MVKLPHCISTCLLVLVFITGCNAIGAGDGGESVYPTTFEMLEPERLNALQQEFASENPNMCSPLNTFGFTEWDLGPCLDRDRQDLASENVDSLYQAAADAVIENAQFTGVADSSLLDVNEGRSSISSSRAIIAFEHQRIHGMEVKDTQILVAMDGTGVFMIGGNWFPGIHIPEANRIGRRKARARLVGQELTYSDWTGQKTYVIGENDFSEELTAQRIVLPIKDEDTIRLHIAWKIGLYASSSSEYPWWYVYVDTQTGERLRAEILVDF